MRYDELNHKEQVCMEAIEKVYLNNKYIDKKTYIKTLLFLLNKYK